MKTKTGSLSAQCLGTQCAVFSIILNSWEIPIWIKGIHEPKLMMLSAYYELLVFGVFLRQSSLILKSYPILLGKDLKLTNIFDYLIYSTPAEVFFILKHNWKMLQDSSYLHTAGLTWYADFIAKIGLKNCKNQSNQSYTIVLKQYQEQFQH